MNATLPHDCCVETCLSFALAKTLACARFQNTMTSLLQCEECYNKLLSQSTAWSQWCLNVSIIKSSSLETSSNKVKPSLIYSKLSASSFFLMWPTVNCLSRDLNLMQTFVITPRSRAKTSWRKPSAIAWSKKTIAWSPLYWSATFRFFFTEAQVHILMTCAHIFWFVVLGIFCTRHFLSGVLLALSSVL